MIFEAEARRYVAAMAWPEDAPKPNVRMWHTERGFHVLLHETISRGWGDISRVVCITPERALQVALEEWLVKQKINNQPSLYQAIRRLTN